MFAKYKKMLYKHTDVSYKHIHQRVDLITDVLYLYTAHQLLEMSCTYYARTNVDMYTVLYVYLI